MTIYDEKLEALAREHLTPFFVYDEAYLKDRARVLIDLKKKLPFGFTPRFAAKANMYPGVIELFDTAGLHFDAGSSYEAMELIRLGVEGHKISLSSQQPAHNLPELIGAGINYIATSLNQLELFAAAAKQGSKVGLRINPGLGAGHNNRTTTGGANSSFGLWNAYLPEALQLAKDKRLTINKLHVHIGSGADPLVWRATIETALELAWQMPDVEILNIGGGYKIHRFADEQEADMGQIVEVFADELARFANDTGRQLRLEIEPGTWLVGHAGVLLSTIQDIVDTGPDGHHFLRCDTGMNDFIRPSMYGAQHEIKVLNDSKVRQDYVVVGHNCETGDILTTAPGDPEGIEARELNKAAIGDLIAIYDCGAYCASFSTHGYNSYPDAGQILV
ncbi:MAG TPA: hypothetical protein VFL81_02545 [Candidatus Saccharimonadales bacterium]|nr:hypothetical protein [Candidatus Saccharimonadales bacterium]